MVREDRLSRRHRPVSVDALSRKVIYRLGLRQAKYQDGCPPNGMQ